MALIAQDQVLILAFDTREMLLQWQMKIRAYVPEGQYRSWSPDTVLLLHLTNDIFSFPYRATIFGPNHDGTTEI